MIFFKILNYLCKAKQNKRCLTDALSHNSAQVSDLNHSLGQFVKMLELFMTETSLNTLYETLIQIF